MGKENHAFNAIQLSLTTMRTLPSLTKPCFRASLSASSFPPSIWTDHWFEYLILLKLKTAEKLTLENNIWSQCMVVVLKSRVYSWTEVVPSEPPERLPYLFSPFDCHKPPVKAVESTHVRRSQLLPVSDRGAWALIWSCLVSLVRITAYKGCW